MLIELNGKKQTLTQKGINAKKYAMATFAKSVVLPQLCDIIENSINN